MNTDYLRQARQCSHRPQFSGSPAAIAGDKLDALDVVAHIEARHIRGVEPSGLLHVVGDHHAVDGEIFEGDVPDLASLVIAADHRWFGAASGISDVSKGDVLDATPGRRAVFAVIKHPQVHELPAAEILHPD